MNVIVENHAARTVDTRVNAGGLCMQDGGSTAYSEEEKVFQWRHAVGRNLRSKFSKRES